MPSPVMLDRSIDLYISMTWPKSRERKHGICGHLFEIVDYYLLLKDRFNIGILIGEEIAYDYTDTILDKYDLSETEISELLSKTKFVDRPDVLIGNNILFVDGLLKNNFQKGGVKLMFKNIFTFRCTHNSDHSGLHYKSVTLLQDQRIYKDDNEIAIDYVKKINFSRLKKLKDAPQNVALVYATSNCRMLDLSTLIEIVNQYKFDKYVFVTNMNYELEHEKIEIHAPPVMGLFNMFSTYIYTPTHKGFDCSSRLIAECAYYNKQVLYHNITDEYLQKDTGLKYRRQDVEASLDNVTLDTNDWFVSLLNEKLSNN